MGCCASSIDPAEVGAMLSRELKIDAASERDLIQAYRSFKRVDSNGDGKIQKKEFAAAFKLTGDVFLDRLFMLLDCDGTGFIDFREFVIGMGAFHLSNSTGRVRFAFRLLDLDDNGAVSKDEFAACIKASVDLFKRTKKGQQLQNPNDWRDKAPRDMFANYKDLFTQLSRASGNSITFADFTNIVVKYPKLFAPVNFIWNNLRKFAKPCGELCKVVARAGHHGFFHGSMLENGWPGVKFYAPSWQLSERNVYMRSLSNLFKRRGVELDQGESLKNMEHNRSSTQALPSSSAPPPTKRTSEDRRRDGRLDMRNSMLSPTRAPRSAPSIHDHGTIHRGRHVESARDVSSYARDRGAPHHDTHRVQSTMDVSAYAERNDRAPPSSYARQSQQPKFIRQFSWGNDDPNSEMARREMLASNSMEKAYNENFAGNEYEPELWLEDDIQPPQRAGKTYEQHNSIEEIWDALNNCPSATATRHYTPHDYVPNEYYQERLQDGVYFKKNFSAARSSGVQPPVYQHERRY